MTTDRSRLLLRGFAVVTFFTAFAGQFWRNLLGWWGFGIVAAIVVVVAVVILIRAAPPGAWRRVPISVVVFLGLTVVSSIWSFYPAATALGAGLQIATSAVAFTLALCLSREEFVATLSWALRWILAASLLFEAFVAIVIRGPLLPNFVHYEGTVPKAFYWSRGLLLDGGPIEGIVANRNLLGFIALIALIVFTLQWFEGSVQRRWGLVWIIIAAGTLILTRSATVTLAAAVVAVVTVFALWARRRPADARGPIYATALAILALGAVAAVASWSFILEVFGKSEDLTGRFDIWHAVSSLIAERPLAGWGWVSYWAPWVEPFDGLAERKGVVYLQAHSAWLDVGMQLGVIGLIVFAAIVISTLWRSWFLAIDQEFDTRGNGREFSPMTLLPLLLLTALIAQSFAESRILVEGGWLLLVSLAILTKRGPMTSPLTRSRRKSTHA